MRKDEEGLACKKISYRSLYSLLRMENRIYNVIASRPPRVTRTVRSNGWEISLEFLTHREWFCMGTDNICILALKIWIQRGWDT